MSRKEHTSSKERLSIATASAKHPTHKQPSAGVCAVQSTICSTKTQPNHNFGARISTKSKTLVKTDPSANKQNSTTATDTTFHRIDTSCLSRATYTSPIKDNN